MLENAAGLLSLIAAASPSKPSAAASPSPATLPATWVERSTQHVPDFVHVLSPNGRILHTSQSCVTLTGYHNVDLLGRFIGDLVHPDDNGVFMTEFFRAIMFEKSSRCIYRFLHKDSTWLIFEANLSPIPSTKINTSPTEPIIRPGLALQTNTAPPKPDFPPHILAVARPYLTETNRLLDSFLEHKIEHERLLRQIRDLKSEELLDEAEELRIARSQHIFQMQDGALSEILDAGVVRSIDDTTIPESPREPTTFGDLGLAIPLAQQRPERPPPAKSRKRRVSLRDSHVCYHCGTTTSTEWRKGPDGPKTLCNACGLRWSKSNRREGPATARKKQKTADRESEEYQVIS